MISKLFSRAMLLATTVSVAAASLPVPAALAQDQGYGDNQSYNQPPPDYRDQPPPPPQQPPPGYNGYDQQQPPPGYNGYNQQQPPPGYNGYNGGYNQGGPPPPGDRKSVV